MANINIMWFVNRDDQQRGPFSQADIQMLVETGGLQRTDFVWRVGFDDWMQANDVPELFGPAIAPPPFRRPVSKVGQVREQAESKQQLFETKTDVLVSTVDPKPKYQVSGNKLDTSSAQADGNFRDIGTLTTLLITLLMASAAISLGSLLLNISQYNLLSDFENGRYVLESARAALASNEQLGSSIGKIYLAVWITTALSFLVWIYRANFNARQLGAKSMEFTPGWSVGWYFVPLANLWMPYQAMMEIWKASKNPGEWAKEANDPLIPVWWIFFLCAGFLGQASFRASMNANTLPDFLNATIILSLGDIVAMISALVSIALISKISNFQIVRIPANLSTGRGKLTMEKLQEARSLVASGMSVHDAAVKLQVSREALATLLR